MEPQSSPLEMGPIAWPDLPGGHVGWARGCKHSTCHRTPSPCHSVPVRCGPSEYLLTPGNKQKVPTTKPDMAQKSRTKRARRAPPWKTNQSRKWAFSKERSPPLLQRPGATCAVYRPAKKPSVAWVPTHGCVCVPSSAQAVRLILEGQMSKLRCRETLLGDLKPPSVATCCSNVPSGSH